MFTGLIEALGRIESAHVGPEGGRIRVAAPFASDLRAGDSVAVNGVCLTAVAPDATGFQADLGPATLRVTTLGAVRPGQLVNLERPLRADARIGGHFVLGHVDGLGAITAIRPEGGSYWFDIAIPASLESLVIDKGSIAIDGISLTVAALAPGRVSIQIIPHTFTHTSLGAARVGDAVNLEGDVLGKYIARLASLGFPAPPVPEAEPTQP